MGLRTSLWALGLLAAISTAVGAEPLKQQTGQEVSENCLSAVR